MLEELQALVWKANMDLVREGLVIHTWGNASGIDRSKGLVVIKPSGVPYDKLKPEHMVIVDLQSGDVVHGKLKPSSDTPTHLALYRGFDAVGGIVHTHSLYATAWAQTGREIPALGTTHADYFHGPVRCTRRLAAAEIEGDYEANTGSLILETFRGLNAMSSPAVLVASHGPFAWGANAPDAVHTAVVLETIARMASETLRISSSVPALEQVLLDKHFLRKHGPKAYYGQADGSEGQDKNKPK